MGLTREERIEAETACLLTRHPDVSPVDARIAAAVSIAILDMLQEDSRAPLVDKGPAAL